MAKLDNPKIPVRGFRKNHKIRAPNIPLAKFIVHDTFKDILLVGNGRFFVRDISLSKSLSNI